MNLDRYSAVVLNRMKGMRAREGNFNEPWDMGRFLNDLPAANHVRFVNGFPYMQAQPVGAAIVEHDCHASAGDTLDNAERSVLHAHAALVLEEHDAVAGRKGA